MSCPDFLLAAMLLSVSCIEVTSFALLRGAQDWAQARTGQLINTSQCLAPPSLIISVDTYIECLQHLGAVVLHLPKAVTF